MLKPWYGVGPRLDSLTSGDAAMSLAMDYRQQGLALLHAAKQMELEAIVLWASAEGACKRVGQDFPDV